MHASVMSIDHSTAPHSIRELSGDELDAVSGGIAPAVIAAGIAAAGAIATAAIAAYQHLSSDDCTTTKKTNPDGSTVETTVCT